VTCSATITYRADGETDSVSATFDTPRQRAAWIMRWKHGCARSGWTVVNVVKEDS
jgi:hypothetical protein